MNGLNTAIGGDLTVERNDFSRVSMAVVEHREEEFAELQVC